MKRSDANLKLQLLIVSSLPGRHGKRGVGDLIEQTPVTEPLIRPGLL